MILDCSVVVLVLLGLSLGHFLGVWRHLGVVAALIAGYALTPLWVAAATPRVAVVTGWPPLFAAVACVAFGVLLPALLAAAALRNLEGTPENPSGVTVVLEALAGSLAWGTGALVLVAALLGAFALREQDALVTSDRMAFPLRTSRAYEEVARLGLLRPEPPTLTMPAASLDTPPAAAPPRLKIDDAAMRRDPRLRAALADPVVRRAMETGDYAELEKRNHALRPLAPPPEAKPRKREADPDVPSFIDDPRDLR